MTERSRFDQAWPSLLAMFGTIAVVLVLLWAFGEDSAPADEEDGSLVAEGDEQQAGDAEAEVDPSPTASPEETEPTPEPTTAPPELRSPVAILNSTSVAGLAGRAEQILEAGGWDVPAIADYNTGELAETTIFYPDESMLDSAEALMAQFPEIGAAEPTIAGLTRQRLVLILTTDWAETYGGAEESGDAG